LDIKKYFLKHQPKSRKGISLSVKKRGVTQENYVIADLRQDCLHVLSPYGKFIGILRCENGDILSETSAVCVDSEDNIWVDVIYSNLYTMPELFLCSLKLSPS
jgi:hypothetical protein